MCDFDKTCRTCMKSCDSLVELYQPSNFGERVLQIVEILMDCTSAQVAPEDGLPQKICEDCLSKLQITYKFRNQTVQAEIELRKIVLYGSIKNEPFERKDDIENYNSYDLHDDYQDDSLESSIKKEDLELMTELEIEINKTGSKSKFECSQCSKSFSSKKSLENHICTHVNYPSYVLNNDENIKKEAGLFNSIKNTENVIVKNEIAEEGHKCNICDLICKNPRSLLSHMRKHNKELSFQCAICESKFNRKCMLRRHIKLHSEQKPYECTKCDKKYTRSDQYKAHMKSHSNTKPNICPHCNKGFSQLCNLKDHLRIHTGETPFLCSECGKGFNNSSNLRQHMMRHTGLKPYACRMCPKTFCTKGQMTSHMETHTGAHPYNCEECGHKFTKPQSLKKHAMIHLGLKPFECDACTMRFSSKDHLKRHSRIHTGEKPYQCRYCERGFTQSNDLTKHLRIHVGQNIYKCTVCNMRFRILNDLKKHFPMHYKNGEEIPPINKGFDFIAEPESKTELMQYERRASKTIQKDKLPPKQTNKLNINISDDDISRNLSNSYSEMVQNGVQSNQLPTLGDGDGSYLDYVQSKQISDVKPSITITYNPDMIDNTTGKPSITINVAGER